MAKTGFKSKTVQKITAWSFSRWKAYDECPYSAKQKFIEKIKTPSGPAMERGNLIHKAAEAFVKGDVKRLDPLLKPVASHIKRYKKLGAQSELEITVTNKWKPTGWFDTDAWLRIKVDLMLLIPKKKIITAEVVDYKTGKFKPDNEDYEMQLSLYAAGTFSTEPDVNVVDTKLLFTDHNEVVEKTYERDELKGLIKTWENRIQPMMNDTLFAPRPGWYCRYCHFRKSNGGTCEY